jgi:hypothetical protein
MQRRFKSVQGELKEVMEAEVNDLKKRFTYHAPKEGQPKKYEQIRAEAFSFSLLLNDLCPESREKSLAITHLEDAVMWANKSISGEEDEDEKEVV